jgi:hypothetical protein
MQSRMTTRTYPIHSFHGTQDKTVIAMLHCGQTATTNISLHLSHFDGTRWLTLFTLTLHRSDESPSINVPLLSVDRLQTSTRMIVVVLEIDRCGIITTTIGCLPQLNRSRASTSGDEYLHLNSFNGTVPSTVFTLTLHRSDESPSINVPLLSVDRLQTSTRMIVVVLEIDRCGIITTTIGCLPQLNRSRASTSGDEYLHLNSFNGTVPSTVFTLTLHQCDESQAMDLSLFHTEGYQISTTDKNN